MIKFQQSQALTSHFESFWSIVRCENVKKFLLVNLNFFITLDYGLS